MKVFEQIHYNKIPMSAAFLCAIWALSTQSVPGKAVDWALSTQSVPGKAVDAVFVDS